MSKLSRFYGTVTGYAKTSATRRGNIKSGLKVSAATGSHGISVELEACGDFDIATVVISYPQPYKQEVLLRKVLPHVE